VLFSAAVPGQGGPGHVNEKPLDWWEEKFAARRFRVVRGFGMRFENDQRVAWWYTRNMVFLVQEGKSIPEGVGLIAVDGAVTPISKPSVTEKADSAPESLPAPGHSKRDPCLVRLEQVLPVIMTCARDVPLVERFIDSYVHVVGPHLPAPVLSIDLTGGACLQGDYLRALQHLRPAAAHIHPRLSEGTDKDSVNDAAFFAIAAGLHEMRDREFLLFLEDDTVFSSEFIPFLSQLQLMPDVALYTLYQPDRGYGSEVVDPSRFIGTQCVLFPKWAVSMLLAHREEMEQRFNPNYDVRWGGFFGSRGLEVRASPRSFVQHIGIPSRMDCGPHTSKTFEP
jgi:hypothetical protein